MKLLVNCSPIQICKIVILSLVKMRNLNTCDNIVVESCIMRLHLRNTPAHNIFSTESKYQHM